VQTQCYALTDPLEIELPSADEGQEEAEQRRQLLRATGLTGRLDHEASTAEQAQKLWLATQAYPELVERVYRLWRGFLPTTYRLIEYRFDEIPVESLEAISVAQQLGCFDRIEIWTPEGNSFFGYLARKIDVAREKLAELAKDIDPMAVGVVVGPDGVEHFFQLVRWGEALLPLNKIKRHVRSVQWRLRLLFKILPTLLGCALLAGYYILIERLGFWPVVGTTIGAVVVLAGLVFMASLDD